RRKNRHDHENHHDDRHGFGHATAAIHVAYYRHSDHARGSCTKALERAQDQHEGETWGEGCDDRPEDKNAEAEEQRRTATKAVGRRAVEELTYAKPHHVGCNN